MRRATLLLLLSGCLDFDGLLSRCRDAEGACAPDGAGGGSGGGSVAPSPAEGFCFEPGDAGRFCWENPLPQGNELTSAWGSSPDDVWLGGSANTLMHWDGGRWTSYQQQVAPTREGEIYINGLWGDGQGFVIATNTKTEPYLLTPAGWARDEVSGQRELRGITGTARGNLWAAGERGALWHYDGTTWSPNNIGLEANGTYVALSPDGRQLVGAFTGFAVVCDTAACSSTARELVDSGYPLAGVGWTSLGALAVDERASYWEGEPDAGFDARVTDAGIIESMFAVATLPDAGVFIAGEYNSLYRRTRPDGAWAPMTVEHTDATQRFNTLFTFPGQTGSVVAGVGGIINRLQANGTWQLQTKGSTSTVAQAIETAEGHFLASANGLLVRDGGRWQKAEGPTDTPNPLSFSRARDGGAWIGTYDGRVERWQRPGRAVPYWSSGLSDVGVSSIRELPAGLALVVGGGVFLVSSPDASTYEIDAGVPVASLDGWDESHLWAATQDGRVASRSADGGWSWEVLGGSFEFVFADRDAGVFVCGVDNNDSASAWHLEANGTFAKDSVVVSPDSVGQRLKAIAGTSAQNLWMIADHGRLFRWDAANSIWQLAAETGTRQQLNALIVHERELWLFGDQGTVIHYTF